MMKNLIAFLSLIAALACSLLLTSCVDSPPSSSEEELPPVFEDGVSIMDFFNQISGHYTVLGIHNREPNSQPAMQTDEIKKITGRYPGLWSGDFLYDYNDVNNRWTMIEECKRQWDNGAIVHLMLHVVSPKSNTEYGDWTYNSAGTGVRSDLNNLEWSDLITDGGVLNKKWKARLDIYSEYFQYLKNNGVTVLFRPFHEMNQTQFWWSGRPGVNGTSALFRLTHDYMVKEKGLDNIIWVWSMQDLNYNWEQYDPGAGYWDIFTVDFYSFGGFTTYKYKEALRVAGNKPIAIGETQNLPTSQTLKSQPRWVFCMSWAELTFDHNTDQKIQTLYNASNTLTRDNLPEFIGADSGNYVRNGKFSSVASAWPNLPNEWDTASTGGDGYSPIKTEDGRFVGWAQNKYNFTLSQTITGLKIGTYTFSADFRLKSDSTIGDIAMNVYSGGILLESKSIRGELLDTPRETDARFSLTDIQVTSSQVKIEFAGSDIVNYIGIDNVTFF